MNANSKNRVGQNINTGPVAVFDICDTLYYSNTTHDFIGYLARQKFGPLRRILYYVVNHRLSPVRYALIILSVSSGLDLHKKIAVRLMKGISGAEISALARDFVRTFLAGRKIAEVHQRLKEFSNNGSEIVLCSTSIEPVVAAVAAELSVGNFTCTTLEYDGNVLTGRIKADITGKKVEALRNDLGVATPDHAISDNREDLSMLLVAGRGTAVVHSDRKFDFWKEKDVEMIDLRKDR